MKRAVLVWPLAAALFVGVTGCSEKTPGTATPGDGTTTSTVDSSTAAPTKSTKPSSGPDSPLGDVGPCDLMTSSAASELGLTGKGNEEKLGRGRSCRWSIRGATAKDSMALSVTIYDSLGLADVVANGEVKTIPAIGKHDAAQYTGVADNCVFALSVSKSTRVDVAGTGPLFDKSCEVASKAAKLVEPELP